MSDHPETLMGNAVFEMARTCKMVWYGSKEEVQGVSSSLAGHPFNPRRLLEKTGLVAL